MGEHVIKPLTSPGMQDAATETHSSLIPFTVLNHKLHDWGLGGAGDRTLGGQ